MPRPLGDEGSCWALETGTDVCSVTKARITEGTETSAVVYATVQERGSLNISELCRPYRKIECSNHTNRGVGVESRAHWKLSYCQAGEHVHHFPFSTKRHKGLTPSLSPRQSTQTNTLISITPPSVI
jgi:hypothetical protein